MINTKPRSDQWNADDFIPGPKTFTIANVGEGKAEGNHDIELVEGEGRVWRPPLTVLRILEAAWGEDGDNWAGRRVTLYRDPDVRMGRDVTGGIRVSHISGIDRALTVTPQTSRGKRAAFTVQPLTEPVANPKPSTKPAPPTDAEVANAATPDALMAVWDASDKSADTKTRIQARKAELDATKEES